MSDFGAEFDKFSEPKKQPIVESTLPWKVLGGIEIGKALRVADWMGVESFTLLITQPRQAAAESGTLDNVFLVMVQEEAASL